MNNSAIKQIISSAKSEIQYRFKADVRGIFGSCARGDMTESSDVDILVHFHDGATLIELSGLAMYLTERIGRPVDIVSDRAIREEISSTVLNELVSV
ncbi:MAG: nucleotidyltransferase family protein [Fibrobacterota bacterium]